MKLRRIRLVSGSSINKLKDSIRGRNPVRRCLRLSVFLLNQNDVRQVDITWNPTLFADFLINMDNHSLKSELKVGDSEVEVIRARWKYGLVLIGLALLHDDAQSKRVDDDNSDNEDENADSIDKRVRHFTRAIAPVLLPMINSLGGLEIDEAVAGVASGEAT